MNKKKIILIVAVAVLIIASFLFWRFRNKPNFDINTDFANGLESMTIKNPTSSSSSTSMVGVKVKREAATGESPVYRGRDPQEFNPNPEIVKSFSGQQKEQLSADIRKYGDMVKNQPEYANAWLQIGLLKKVIGDYIGARDAWEYVALTRPNEQVAFKNLADLYWRYLPDYKKAEFSFKRAISNKPDDISAYRDFSEFYVSFGKDGLALQVLQQGIAAYPDDLNLIKALASFYDDHKDYKQALEWWRKAQERDPQNTGIGQIIENLEKKIVQ